MPLTYEDLTTEPWAQFNELVKRSLTFAVYVDGIQPDTLAEGAAALQFSLDSVDEVAIEVPEVGEETLPTIADGLARLDDDGMIAIRVKAKLQGVELSMFITRTYVTCIVPAVAVMDDDPDPSTAPEDFKMLVQFGLELCELLGASALYLLDDDDEFRISHEDDDASVLPDGDAVPQDLAPIWQRDPA